MPTVLKVARSLAARSRVALVPESLEMFTSPRAPKSRLLLDSVEVTDLTVMLQAAAVVVAALSGMRHRPPNLSLLLAVVVVAGTLLFRRAPMVRLAPLVLQGRLREALVAQTAVPDQIIHIVRAVAVPDGRERTLVTPA
jgi:hypothetical protein